MVNRGSTARSLRSPLRGSRPSPEPSGGPALTGYRTTAPRSAPGRVVGPSIRLASSSFPASITVSRGAPACQLQRHPRTGPRGRCSQARGDDTPRRKAPQSERRPTLCSEVPRPRHRARRSPQPSSAPPADAPRLVSSRFQPDAAHVGGHVRDAVGLGRRLEPQPHPFGESGTTRSSSAGLARARGVRRARATPPSTHRTSRVSPSWFVFPRRTVTSTPLPAAGSSTSARPSALTFAPPHPGHKGEDRDDDGSRRPRSMATSLGLAAAPARLVAGGRTAARSAAPNGRARPRPSAGSRPAPVPVRSRPGSVRRRGEPGSTPRPPPPRRSPTPDPGRGAWRGTRCPRAGRRQARRRVVELGPEPEGRPVRFPSGLARDRGPRAAASPRACP